jgi:inner membrane protein
LQSGRLAVFVSLLLCGLYGYLFIILQMEAYALLMGSIALFVVMALVMYFSRNVDWYKPLGKAPGGSRGGD